MWRDELPGFSFIFGSVDYQRSDSLNFMAQFCFFPQAAWVHVNIEYKESSFKFLIKFTRT